MLVLYSTATGFVFGQWWRNTSDNGATMIADGHLTIDGDVVVAGMGSHGGEDDEDEPLSDLATVVLVTQTAADVTAGVGSHEVDDPGTPTDIVERTDAGREPSYPYTE
jgi:hypothetical protein